MNFAHAIAIAAILTSILTSGGSCLKSCRTNASLMKSIQYQLKLVEDNDRKCDCNQSPSTPNVDDIPQSTEPRKVYCRVKKGKYDFTGSGKVGFLVYNSKDLQNIGKGAIVVYDLVTTNIGGGYDKSTGVFTAREDGLYYFTWTVLGKSFYTHLILNDTVVAKHHAGATVMTSHMPSSQSVVLQMNKNDKVSIRLRSSGGHYMTGEKWSSFSGFKI